MIKSSSRVFLFLFSAVFIVYSQALGGEFLWDDFILVGENPFFKSPVFILEVFRHTLFPGFASSYYRPVQNISYMFDYWVWNRNSFGYHLSNILFHTTVAFLLFKLLQKLIPGLRASEPVESQNSRMIAFIIALVWAIHPIHNAAVAYIAGRADSLAAIFALAAWLFWIKSQDVRRISESCNSASEDRLPACLGERASSLLNLFATFGDTFVPIGSLLRQRIGYGIGAGISLMLALCSKEIALVWIALFLFHLFVFNKGTHRKVKLITIGLIGGCLVGYWFLRHLPEKGIPIAGMPSLPWDVRILFALRALGDYVGLIFFPVHLQMERAIYKATAYGSMEAWQESMNLEYLSSIGLLSLIIGTLLCLKKANGQSVRLFGAGWFLIGFLPISNLFPLNAQSAEHWIYMPSIGFLVFLTGCYFALPKKFMLRLGVPLGIAIVLLGVRTWVRGGDWETAEIFYTRTIEQGGRTCRVQLSLADLKAQAGDLIGAEHLLRDALQRYPGEKVVRIHLGRLLIREGKNTEARQYLSFESPELLVNERPKTWKIAQGLAKMKQSEGKIEEGLSILEEALARYGDVWELVALKAELTVQKEGDRAGIAVLQSFANSHWWHYGVFMGLAQLQWRVGDKEAALTSVRHAAILDIHASAPGKLSALILNGSGI